MSDVEELETALRNHGGTDAGSDALPSGFSERLTALTTASDDRIAAERQVHVDQARWLIGQLDNSDNLVVKTSKKRVIQAEINAIKLIDELG